ncbi:MAG TPA: iron-containing redox enzyme family protein [Chloroflexota bacterium]|nr:iron-containing redox enzyme family protein [Chloroflexota bacterium]
MATVMDEYLVEPRTEWVRRIRDEIILPRRAQAAQRPLTQAIRHGTANRQQILAGLLIPTLWRITRFPELIAALASRCPTFDWERKTSLLQNAYEETEHPFLLARAVRALGGDPDPVLRGDPEAYRPSTEMQARRDWITYHAYHRPWIEGIAAVQVAIEAIVPYALKPVWHGLREHYGLSDHDLAWFQVHAGEIEMRHGNEGILILEQYVADDDVALQQRLRYIVDYATSGTTAPGPVAATS